MTVVTNIAVQAKPESIREHIKGQILSAILEGRLLPGQRLVELELAAQFQVSQGTIRESICLLESSGLVESIRNRGTWVRNVDVAEMAKAYELRAAIEGFAAMTVAKNRNIRLDDLFKCAELTIRYSEDFDLESYSEYDLKFHEILVQSSGNDILVRAWNNIGLSVRARLLYSLAMKNPDAVRRCIRERAPEHLEIARSIELGDSESARRKTEHHLLLAASGANCLDTK